jgi:hypothetical protein
LIAISFFISAALLGLVILAYFGNLGSRPLRGAASSALSPLPGAPPLGAHVSSALGVNSVLSGRTPSRVLRRTFRDEASGAEVVEESAYFDVPQGEGEALAAAVKREQEALGTGLDEILLRKAVTGGFLEGGEGEEPAAPPPPPLPPPLPPPPPPPPAAAAAPRPLRAAAAAAAAAAPPDASEWVPLTIPTRPASWVAPQRAIPGEREGVPASSPPLAASLAASLSPPRALSTLPPGDALELSNRLVVAVALGVHCGKLRVGTPGDRAALGATPLVTVMLDTFLATAQPHHEYRFYFAFDHNDPVYEVEANRDVLSAIYAEAFEAENARRWHPAGYVPGAIDGSTLVGSVHWVHCDYSGKPGWAHSDAAMAAVKEGADYVYRTNDDSKFPETGDWADRFVAELRARSPVPNLGVTGPACNEGATWCVRRVVTAAPPPHPLSTRFFSTRAA